MEIELLLAKKIREARSRKGCTLQQLSKRSGISVAMLSKIENAKASTPVSGYAKIAKALDVHLSTLFSENGYKPLSIVRKKERKRCTQSTSYSGEAIAYKKSNKKMEPFIHIYPPKKTKLLPYQHDNEELLFVISGKLECKYGDETYILEEGDCAYFDANIRHWAGALGEEAVALVVEV